MELRAGRPPMCTCCPGEHPGLVLRTPPVPVPPPSPSLPLQAGSPSTGPHRPGLKPETSTRKAHRQEGGDRPPERGERGSRIRSSHRAGSSTQTESNSPPNTHTRKGSRTNRHFFKQVTRVSDKHMKGRAASLVTRETSITPQPGPAPAGPAPAHAHGKQRCQQDRTGRRGQDGTGAHCWRGRSTEQPCGNMAATWPATRSVVNTPGAGEGWDREGASHL